ncbi:MAG TPA: DUF1987 domain-containing protein [Bacteroidales bacterium]|jgi:hypothetical protein|nr:DUF1987 domain-containing protein [Bacteroidales bacterium]HNV94941.1 DUF1987 domain-containing protein [Bacteroidales bacterium]HOU99133.1 DUF1987 domain-containing protein [Bacteroidales bacterium]
MLEPLVIQKQEDTPSVILNKEEGAFEIGHRSLPENAIAFYEPVLNWLNEYKNNPLPKTIFNFKLEYFNTASAKQLAKVLLVLQELAQTNDVLIRWHYLKDDADMHSSGLRFSKLLKIPFEFIEM